MATQDRGVNQKRIRNRKNLKKKKTEMLRLEMMVRDMEMGKEVPMVQKMLEETTITATLFWLQISKQLSMMMAMPATKSKEMPLKVQRAMQLSRRMELHSAGAQAT